MSLEESNRFDRLDRSKKVKATSNIMYQQFFWHKNETVLVTEKFVGADFIL